MLARVIVRYLRERIDEFGNAFKVPVLRGDDRIKDVEGGRVQVTLPTGASANMTVKVVYDGPIKAPIAKGQHAHVHNIKTKRW